MNGEHHHSQRDVRLIWIGSVADGLDHAVTQATLAAGVLHRSGRHEAVCGHGVLPGSMLEPPGPTCPRCTAYLRAQAPRRAAEERAQRRRYRTSGLLRRWLGCSDPPAGTGAAPTMPVPAGSHRVSGGA